MRRFYILSLILVFGFAFCLTSGFAEKNKNGELIEEINDVGNFITEGNFEFPTPDGPAYIQGTPEFQRVPDFIFGSPDFEKMRDLPPSSRDYTLGTRVGMIRTPSRFDPSSGYICTGFLVGPDLFMTNHHCIHDDFGVLPLHGAEIYMDYYQEPNVDRTLGGVTAGVAEILRVDSLKDYALLRLDKPIGNTYGWLELDTTTRVNPVGESAKLISHNRGRSKEIVRRNSQIVGIPGDHPLINFPFAIAYLADSELGSSGSPVFLREGTVVIAINHSGWTRNGIPHFNAGSLMSYIVPEIQQWLPGSAPPPPPTPPPTPTGDQMYWSDVGADKIQRANLNGSNIQDLVSRVKTWGITLDVRGGKMYYTNDFGGKIQRANLDGSNIEDLVTTRVIDPADIELDIAGGKMYWTDFEDGKIQRANLNGSNVQDLITGLTTPNNIALDIAGGKMYWTDNNAETIQRANLNGSNIQDLITGDHGLRGPIGIALDVAGGKMYWVDNDVVTGRDKIQRANLDGSNIQDLVIGLDHPNCIALDVASGKMYWTERLIGKIQRANFDGSHIEDLITHGLNQPRDIALGIPPAGGPNPPSPPGPGDDPLDVNRDGLVNVLDLVLVAVFYGTRGDGLPADVNADGIVNVQDFAAVAAGVDAANALSPQVIEEILLAAMEQAADLEDAPAAPMGFRNPPRDALPVSTVYGNVADALVDTRDSAVADGRLGQGVALLETLLQLLTEMGAIPETMALLPNYPNPFNPETWIPYHLATDADVTLTIYDVRGSVVRTFALGHQPAGVYESHGRAAYWDGKNQLGEPVASGLYFYMLTAGEFTATRKLLIAK